MGEPLTVIVEDDAADLAAQEFLREAQSALRLSVVQRDANAKVTLGRRSGRRGAQADDGGKKAAAALDGGVGGDDGSGEAAAPLGGWTREPAPSVIGKASPASRGGSASSPMGNAPPQNTGSRNPSQALGTFGFVRLKAGDVFSARVGGNRLEIIMTQVTAGIFSARNVSIFLSRMANTYKKFATELHTLAWDEQKKFRDEAQRTGGGDAMHGFQTAAAVLMPDIAKQTAGRARAYASELEKVAKPLLDFAGKAEKTRDSIHKRAKKSIVVVDRLRAEVKEQHAMCLGSYEKLQLSLKQQRDPNKKIARKAAKKHASHLAKATNLFRKFEILRERANEATMVFHRESLPTILRELQSLEEKRLETLQGAIDTYRALHAASTEPLPVFEEFTNVVNNLYIEGDVEKAADKWEAAHGVSVGPDPLNYALPCSAVDLDPSKAGKKARESRGGPEWHAREPANRNPGPSQQWIDDTYPERARQREKEEAHLANANIARTAMQAKRVLGPDELVAIGADAVVDSDEHASRKVAADDTLDVLESPPDKWDSGMSRDRGASMLIGDNVDENAEVVVFAKSLYDWDPADMKNDDDDDDDDDLSYLELKKGCFVEIIAQDSDWWEGEFDGETGFFPSNMVKVVKMTRAQAAKESVINVAEARSAVGKSGSTLVPPVGRMASASARKAGGKSSSKQGSVMATSSFANKLRHKVSKKKRRYQKDGFDLDLSYITPEIITMGYPSEFLQGVYRNSMVEVQRFLNTRHFRRYRVYNLCSERKYDPAKFEGRVLRYPFDDHNPCPLHMVEPFCIDVKKWLESGPAEDNGGPKAGNYDGVVDEEAKNVVVVHCKAGKGRTGFLVACYLIYIRKFDGAEDALRYYGEKRTYNGMGVTIPSQIRYVHYFEKLCRNRDVIPKSNPLQLTRLTLITLPKAIEKEGTVVWFDITMEQEKFSSRTAEGGGSNEIGVPFARFGKKGAKRHATLVFGPRKIGLVPELDHDVKVGLYYKQRFGKAKICQFWFNTRFLQPSSDDPKKTFLRLPKEELDKACKDTGHKLMSADFAIEMEFSQGGGVIAASDSTAAAPEGDSELQADESD